MQQHIQNILHNKIMQNATHISYLNVFSITSNNIGQNRGYYQSYYDVIRKLIQELNDFWIILGWA